MGSTPSRRLLPIGSRSCLPVRNARRCSAVFSPDGELLATANLHHRLQVWESATGRIVRTFEAPRLQPAFAFSPNGELLAVADGRNVAVRDLTTGRVTVTISEPSIVAHVAFGPNSRLLAVAGLDKIVRLHNAVTGARIVTYPGQVGRVTAVAFSPSTALLATTSTDGTARVWRTDGRGSFVSPLIGHQNSVSSAAFSSDGYRVVTASKDGTARIWQALSGNPVAVLAGNAATVTSAAFSDDGRTVVTSSADGAMRFWSAVAQPELALRVQKPWPVAAARVARGGIVIAPRGWSRRLGLGRWCALRVGRRRANRRQTGPFRCRRGLVPGAGADHRRRDCARRSDRGRRGCKRHRSHLRPPGRSSCARCALEDGPC